MERRAHPSRAGLTYALLLSTIFASVWFAGTPLPFGGPNLILGGLAILVAIALAARRIVTAQPFPAIGDFVPVGTVSLVFVAWAAVVHLATDTPWVSRVGQVGFGIGVLFAICMAVTSAFRAWLMIAAIVLATLGSALFGLAVLWVGNSFWAFWIDVANPSVSAVRSVLSTGRIAGLAPTISTLSTQLAVAVPLAFALFLFNPLQDRFHRMLRDIALYATVMILIVAMFANGSRGTLAGAAGGMLCVMASVVFAPPTSRASSFRRLAGTVSLIVLGAIAFLVAWNSLEPRMHEKMAVPSACTESLGTLSESAPVSASGRWREDCIAIRRKGSYARYYSFVLDRDGPLAIDVVSKTKAALFLVAGREISRGGGWDVRLEDTRLAAGVYTAEIASSSLRTSGEFSVTIGTLCRQTIFLGTLGEGVHVLSGWNDNCATSQQRPGSYSRYYSFFLERDSSIIIDLRSKAANAYLYLFSGATHGADILAHDDNAGRTGEFNWWGARIVRQHLPAGMYTIEASTHSPGRRAQFSLSIVAAGADLDRATGQSKETTAKFTTIEPSGVMQTERLLTLGNYGDHSRIGGAKVAILYALDHPLGTGRYAPDSRYLPSNAPPIVTSKVLAHQPHNQFLGILVEYGFPGMILLVLFYLFAARALMRAMRLALRFRNADAVFLTASLSGALASYVFLSLFGPVGPFATDWYHFFLIGLALAVARIVDPRPAHAFDPNQAAIGR